MRNTINKEHGLLSRMKLLQGHTVDARRHPPTRCAWSQWRPRGFKMTRPVTFHCQSGSKVKDMKYEMLIRRVCARAKLAIRYLDNQNSSKSCSSLLQQQNVASARFCQFKWRILYFGTPNAMYLSKRSEPGLNNLLLAVGKVMSSR